MDSYLQLLWLIPLGFFAGGYGTLIGAGGGFVLAPALLLIYPGEAPETITSISLAVVFFNALSGTMVYARSRRIDFKLGAIFAVATMPGAVLGALTTNFISRDKFNLVFGFVLIAVAIFLALNPGQKGVARASADAPLITKLTAPTLLAGVCLSMVFGFFSSF